MNDSHLTHLFSILDMAVMERTEDHRFRMIGPLPKWFSTLNRDGMDLQSEFSIEMISPFLDNFLHDAERVWSGSTQSPFRSGMWVEQLPDGREIRLEGMAASIEGHEILIDQNAIGPDV